MPSSFHFESTCFSNAACTVVCSSAGYVRLNWTAAVTSTFDLQQVYEQTTLAMQRLGLNKILSNHAHRRPISAEMQQWLAEVWVPKAIHDANYGYCAIVESEEALTRLAVRAVGTVVGKQISFRYFNTVAEAEEWLTAQ